MSTYIKPIGMRVLLERVEAERKTEGGLYIPDGSVDREAPKKAIVRELGTGNGKDEFRVAVGNTVIITAYGGVEVKLDGKKYIIMNETDILAVVEEK